MRWWFSVKRLLSEGMSLQGSGRRIPRYSRSVIMEALRGLSNGSSGLAPEQPPKGANMALRLAGAFEKGLADRSSEFVDLKVVVERYVFPLAEDCCWAFTFEWSGDCVEALWNGESEFLMFLNEADYFEAEIPFDDVPCRVAASFSRH